MGRRNRPSFPLSKLFHAFLRGEDHDSRSIIQRVRVICVSLWKYSLASSSIRLPPPPPPPRGEIHEKRRLAENMKLLPSGVMYGFVVSERNSVCVLAYRKGNSVTRLQRGYYIGARQEAFRKKSKHRSWERLERRAFTYERNKERNRTIKLET